MTVRMLYFDSGINSVEPTVNSDFCRRVDFYFKLVNIYIYNNLYLLIINNEMLVVMN